MGIWNSLFRSEFGHLERKKLAFCTVLDSHGSALIRLSWIKISIRSWIFIDLALLDLDPYWECGSGSRLIRVCVGLIMLAAYFCHSRLPQVKYNCAFIKVNWLAACIALRVVGVVLVVFLRRWRKICTILQPMGSKGQFLKKCPKPCLPIKSKETWMKYTPVYYQANANLH
jgi:hypothetical protein